MPSTVILSANEQYDGMSMRIRYTIVSKTHTHHDEQLPFPAGSQLQPSLYPKCCKSGLCAPGGFNQLQVWALGAPAGIR